MEQDNNRKANEKLDWINIILTAIGLLPNLYSICMAITTQNRMLLAYFAIVSIIIVFLAAKQINHVFFLIVIIVSIIVGIKLIRNIDSKEIVESESIIPPGDIEDSSEELEDEQDYVEDTESEEDAEQEAMEAEEERIKKEQEQAKKQEEEYRDKYEENASYTAGQLPSANIDFYRNGILQQSFNGQLLEIDSVDQFTLNYDRNVPIRMEFKHQNLTVDNYGWKIELEDAGDNLIDKFYSRWSKELEVSNISGIGPGQYIITVSTDEHHSDVPYSLDVYYSDTSNYEQEPNNEVSTANQLVINPDTGTVTSYGSLNFYDDKDFYTFEIAKDGHIALKFEHPNMTEDCYGWRIILWNEQSEELFSCYSNWQEISLCSLNEGLPSGKYHIIVQADNKHNPIPYALTLVYKESGNWEKEFNDTVLGANKINSGVPYYGSIHSYDDRDYYQFTCAESGEYELEFSHENFTEESIGWHIQILDEESNVLEEGDFYSQWNEEKCSTCLKLKEGENYYVFVEGYNSIIREDYSIIIRKNIY